MVNRALAFVVISTACFLAAACDGDSSATPTPTREPTAVRAAVPTLSPVPPSPAPTSLSVAQLPIIDLHFHPEGGWGDGLVELFEDLGVQAAGSGAQASDAQTLELAVTYAPRVIPFGGGFTLRQFVLQLGAAAWNLESPEVTAYLDGLDADLAAGRFAGIGEIHVDSTASYFTGTPPIRYPADAPLMQRLWAMSAAHGVPVSVHMDGSPESVEAMERLLASDRSGTWLWAHTGHYAEPPLVRRLLEAHPNLYCELSYRSSISLSRTAVPLDANGVLRPEWRDLLEEFPGRFVLGTDLSSPSHADYARHISFWRAILEQLSAETAALIAHANAEQLVAPFGG
jgi:hypothetical protein